MSNVKVEEFLAKVAEDTALQGELAKALESENDREAVTALANSKGYQFTSEELWAGIQKRQAELAAQQAELSDEELEAVAGGATPTVAVAVTVTAGLVSIGGGISVSKIKW